MNQKSLPLIVLILLMSSQAIQPTQACKLPDIEQFLDTLENGSDLIVERKYRWEFDTTFKFDTIYRSEMIRKLIESYKSSEYVFIATAVFSSFYKVDPETIIDTQTSEIQIKPAYDTSSLVILTPISDQPLRPVYIDSVVIQIDTVIKSSTEEIFDDYQFSVVTPYYILSTKDPISLSALKGKYLLAFTNDVYGGIKPRPRAYPPGFYVDNNGMIIHENYSGVSVPFEDFLEMIETPVRKNINAKSSSEAIRFHPLYNNSLSVTIPFDLLNDKFETAIYDLSGALVNRKMIPVYSSSTTLTFTSLSKGVYTIVISGRDSAKMPFRASIPHCITR